MASPFSIFRKHQKSLMVVLVIGSMIAFTGESLFTGDGENWMLLGVLLGTGISLIAGFQFGRPMEYAIGGAIIGAVIGFAGPKIIGKDGIQSRLGAFDEKRIGEMIARRTAANSFVGEARRRALGFDFGRQPFQLVYQDLRLDTILGEVLRAEADEMGIYIDDDAVNGFIDDETMKRLKQKDFVDVRQMVSINGKPISEKQLYDLLRDEIRAKIALETLAPYGDSDAVTPDVYWDLYRRMNVRQQVAFAPVHVDSFIDTVGEPSDTEIKTMFEKYRDKLPNLEPGSPGFYQARRMKLAYLEADYNSIEAGIAEPTDEEVEKYYEDNKDQFKKASVPDDPTDDGSGDLPSLDALDKAEKEEGAEPEGDEANPGEPGGGDDKQSSEEKAGTEEEDGNEEKNASESEAESDEKGDGCAPWQEESEVQGDDKEDAEAQEGEDNKKENAEAGSAVAPPVLTVPQTNEDPAGADPFKEPPVEYMPLDAELKAQIRETLKRQKTTEAMEKLIGEGIAEMQRLAEKRDEREQAELNGLPTDDEMSDAQILQAMKQFADTRDGLSYAETPLAMGMELLDRQEYPIGSAVPPGSQFGGRQLNVVQTLFGGGGGAALFMPARAELMAYEFDGSVNQFAYWAVAEVPPHIPKMDEPGVREQVIKAWKREQARPKAEERAKAISDQVAGALAEDKTMSDILEDVTESGNDDTAKLVITESLPFSWMRTSSAASPMGMQQETASLTQIDGVRGLTNDFMETIFTKLAPNEVGVATNVDRSIFYVVQPLNRFPSDEADEEAARERFLKTKHFEFNSPMPGLVRQQYGEGNLSWLRRLESKYELDLGI